MKTIVIQSIILATVFTGFAEQTVELKTWKFNTGDNLEWAKPEFDDSAWIPIQAGMAWEDQGYKGYDGYAWYRVSFKLPAAFKTNVFSRILEFSFGRIDDCDQIFLSGDLLGQNAKTLAPGSASVQNDLPKLGVPWDEIRNYTGPVNDTSAIFDDGMLYHFYAFWGTQGNGIGVEISSPLTIRGSKSNAHSALQG